jgi:glutathione S-transferase
VIAEYLEETTPGSLHPAAPLERARHRAWIETGTAALAAIARLYGATTPEAFEQARGALRTLLERLDAEIALPFFSGDAFHLVDGVWGTVFRYFNVFEDEAGVRLCDGLDRVGALRAAVAARPSVRDAAPADYHARLKRFLISRASRISDLIAAREIEAAREVD